MKKQKFIELAVKVVVAALTAFLTALGTTSCMQTKGWSALRWPALELKNN